MVMLVLESAIPRVFSLSLKTNSIRYALTISHIKVPKKKNEHHVINFIAGTIGISEFPSISTEGERFLVPATTNTTNTGPIFEVTSDKQFDHGTDLI